MVCGQDAEKDLICDTWRVYLTEKILSYMKQSNQAFEAISAHLLLLA